MSIMIGNVSYAIGKVLAAVQIIGISLLHHGMYVRTNMTDRACTMLFLVENDDRHQRETEAVVPVCWRDLLYINATAVLSSKPSINPTHHIQPSLHSITLKSFFLTTKYRHHAFHKLLRRHSVRIVRHSLLCTNP
jgi:hypothetical protein